MDEARRKNKIGKMCIWHKENIAEIQQNYNGYPEEVLTQLYLKR